MVELTVEFETDTNPKNLVGNFSWPFPGTERTSKQDRRVYRFDSKRTLHVLPACLNPRSPSQNALAAVQKGRAVAKLLNTVEEALGGAPELRDVARAKGS